MYVFGMCFVNCVWKAEKARLLCASFAHFFFIFPVKWKSDAMKLLQNIPACKYLDCRKEAVGKRKNSFGYFSLHLFFFRCLVPSKRTLTKRMCFVNCFGKHVPRPESCSRSNWRNSAIKEPLVWEAYSDRLIKSWSNA